MTPAMTDGVSGGVAIGGMSTKMGLPSERDREDHIDEPFEEEPELQILPTPLKVIFTRARFVALAMPPPCTNVVVNKKCANEELVETPAEGQLSKKLGIGPGNPSVLVGDAFQ
ncbi:hypothetical protein ACLOJK_007208 [Asimina triloba]